QAETRRAGGAVPHHSGTRARRVCAPRRAAPQHLSQRTEVSERAAQARGRAAAALRGADHRLRGLCGGRRGRLGGPTPRGGRAARGPPATPASGALQNHTGGGQTEPIEGGPPSYQPMNIIFGLSPPLTRAPKAEDGTRLRGKAKALAKKRAITDRARADLEA